MIQLIRSCFKFLVSPIQHHIELAKQKDIGSWYKEHTKLHLQHFSQISSYYCLNINIVIKTDFSGSLLQSTQTVHFSHGDYQYFLRFQANLLRWTPKFSPYLKKNPKSFKFFTKGNYIIHSTLKLLKQKTKSNNFKSKN